MKCGGTVSLLPRGVVGRALEVGWSEGIFTSLLAARVEQLTAADISETALARARRRCAAFGNVDYRCMDFFDEDLPQSLDLLVCSEVLYYLADRRELARLARKLADALAPSGRLLAAHAKELKDDPSSTGF